MIEAGIKPVQDLISMIGSDEFGAAFYKAMNEIVGIDHCTVFMCGDTAPLTLVAEAQCLDTASQVRALAASYIGGGYLRDPIWDQCRHDAAPCSTRLLSPDAFDEPYRQEFYDKPNVQHELAMTSVVAGDRVYAGFYRERGREDFSQETLDRLAVLGALIMEIVHKHAEVAGRKAARPCAKVLDGRTEGRVSQRELFDQVRAAISEQSTQLTAREAEICAGIVLGYTILGISMNLGISINTVATHRKRAYAKLRISSQNELFARYFALVERRLH